MGNTFREHLEEQLKDLEFKRAWDNLQPHYEISVAIAEGLDRLGWTEEQLAKESGLHVRLIRLLEGMDGNPELDQLLRLAGALGCTLEIRFDPVDTGLKN